MHVLALLINLINLFAAALVAGGQVTVLMVIIPTKRRFPTRMSVEVHNAMLGHQIDGYMKPSGITSGVTALLLLLLAVLDVYPMPVLAVACTCLGLLGTLGVVLTSRFGNVPTNAKMLTWSLDAIPEDYPKIRQRWDLTHTIRTGCGVTGFIGYALACLVRVYLVGP